MPRKVEFCVIYASSEDDKFRASELNEHGPTVRGWQSAKDCSYPQEIIFRLAEPIVLVQAQILSHQYLISSRIDLWIGPESPADLDQVAELAFEYLGYVTLADNRTSSYKSRELKSVAIPSPEKTRFFKISLHPNHVNKHNEFNQVGLVAIQLLGEDKGDHGDVSVFDDLSFEMYVDKEVAKIIKQMELKKEEAVKNERFRYAGRLKSAMLTLREAGEKLGRLEVGKVHAIANEDYARATRKKELMDSLRNETYLMLGVKDLLEEDGVIPKNDAANSDATDSTTTLSEDVLTVPKSPDAASSRHEALSISLDQNPVSPVHYTPSVTKTTPTIVQPIRTGSLRRKKVVSPNSAKNSYEAYDERIIPVQRSSSSKETNSTITNINPSCLKMNEREKKQASLAISVFGIALVEKFFSKQYVDKEDGIRDLESILESQEPTNKLFRASTLLLHRALRDKVISVYTIAAALIAQLFTKYVGPRVTTSEMTRSVDKLLPELFSKSGDPTPRVHNTAVHTILTMAHSPEMRKLNIIPVHLTRPLTASTHPRLALSKLEMVEQLILSIGISSDKLSGMTCRTLAEFGASGLHHPAEAVRKVAERVLILVYRVNPRLVRKQLPPDDDITRRNLLYRQLMKEFDKIDLGAKCDIQTHHPSSLKTSVSSYTTSRVPESTNGTGALEIETPNSLPSGNKQCIFCFQICDDFTEEGLNIHYWKYCPMLTRCIHCQEVLEATGVHRHLSVDCELKELYKLCDICGESVVNQKFNEHVLTCTGESRCPFCHQPVENADASWRNHLLDGKTCPKHPRAKYIVKSGTTSPRDYFASSNV